MNDHHGGNEKVLVRERGPHHHRGPQSLIYRILAMGAILTMIGLMGYILIAGTS